MKYLLGAENLAILDDADVIVFDVETLGLKPYRGGLRLVQVSAEGKPVVVVDVFSLMDTEWERLREFFSVPRTWVAHNAVFDVSWLAVHDIRPVGSVRCTLLASRLCSNGTPNIRHGLAAASKRYLSVDIDKEQQTSDWSAPILSAEQLSYAARDVEVLKQLYAHLLRRLTVGELCVAYEIECNAIEAIAHMQQTGLPFSREALQNVRCEYEKQVEEYGQRFLVDLDAALPAAHKLPRDPDGSFNLRPRASGSIRAGTKQEAGFNIASSKQLLVKFTALLGTEPICEKLGRPSVSASALRSYAADHEVVQVYLKWKRAEKRRQLVVALLEHQDPDGFIRSSYVQLGADTGRFSCRTPNLQQVPRDKDFRSAAQAPAGWSFVVCDFSQMELRLAAAISDDAAMRRAFKQGEDLHTLTAQAIYPEPTEDKVELKRRRQIAKSANFGLLFGSGAKGLRNYAGGSGIVMTLEEADAIRDVFRRTYPGITAWQQAAGDTAWRTSGDKWAEVRVPVSGMRRLLPGALNKLTVRCNTPVQGAGAAVLKSALAELWRYVASSEGEAKISAVVHDEVVMLVVEGKEEEWAARLSEIMESAESRWLGDIPALAEASWGPTWADAK